jgi:hypothetical protein
MVQLLKEEQYPALCTKHLVVPVNAFWLAQGARIMEALSSCLGDTATIFNGRTCRVAQLKCPLLGSIS